MTPDMTRKHLRRARTVKGWVSPEALCLFAVLDDIQQSLDVTGDIFEIGVFHGKSATFLAALADPEKEQIGFCDIIEDSCHRSQERVKRFFPRLSVDPVLVGSSADLTPEELPRRCRIFHIDGSHESQAVLQDLRLASSALVEGGCAVLDDISNEEYPGVSDGLYRFLYEEGAPLIPVVFGFGKLVVTHPEVHDAYMDWFHSEKWRAHLRGPGFAGYDTRVFGRDVYAYRVNNRRKLIWRLGAGYVV
jgi:predicted O-methyltransferase YrrM